MLNTRFITVEIAADSQHVAGLVDWIGRGGNSSMKLRFCYNSRVINRLMAQKKLQPPPYTQLLRVLHHLVIKAESIKYFQNKV